MIRTESRAAQLDELLGTGIAAIDIPPAIRARAVARYEEVAACLAAPLPGRGRHPHAGLVPPRHGRRARRRRRRVRHGPRLPDAHVRRDSITQARAQARGRPFAARLHRVLAPRGTPSSSEGKRCWTLDYPGEPFHMDILPAIPDLEALEPAILLTDRELRAVAAVEPGRLRRLVPREMLLEMTMLREAAAVAKRMDIEAVPEDEIKTTLQRTVQALKRHRDCISARTATGSRPRRSSSRRSPPARTPAAPACSRWSPTSPDAWPTSSRCATASSGSRVP